MKSSTYNSKIEEKTEIISGFENTIKRTLQDFSLIKERLDSCIDVTGPSVILSTIPIKNAFIDLKRRGIKTRYITEITKDNLSYCRELMKIVNEVRHLDGIKGNFGVTEFSYIGNATASENRPLPGMVLSTVKSFVEQQRYFFDMLWDKAIPAWQKIKEIEEGWIIPFHNTLYEPRRIVNNIITLVKSTKEEILLILSSDISGKISKQILESIQKMNVKQNNDKMVIKILINSDQKSWYKKNPECNNVIKRNKRLKIRFINSLSQFTVSMIVIDKETAMSFQIGRSDYKNKLHRNSNLIPHALSVHTFSKRTLKSIHSKNRMSKKNQIHLDTDFSLTFGTYTNSKSIVKSYSTIIETLWYHIDLYKQVVQVCKFLQTRDKNLQDFLNITAHEISNPLQSILGLSDILVSQNNLNKDYRTMLNAISNNVTKLHILSKDILDTARLESKSIKLQREDCDIIHLVKSVIKDFKNEKKEIVPIKLILDEVQAVDIDKLRNSITNISSSSSSLIVNIDPHRIAQVITNLLNNAVNFTSHGIIKIFIEIDKELDNIRIKVTDTGTGINNKHMSRLFTKYFSTSKKGSGLGLYICKSIVEQHGGKIWAEKNKDAPGATFTFTIPIGKH